MSTKNHKIKIEPAVIKKTSFKAGSAREAYFKAIVDFNGKTVGEFAEFCKATPPSLPKSGKFEATSGWVSWFHRKKYITLVEPK